MHRKNVEPLENFAFKVFWDGQQIPRISKVSPLIRTTQVLEYRESGSGQTHKFPQHTDYAAIVIERGISTDTAFEQWSNLVVQGGSGTANFHKNITIEVLNEAGQVVVRYEVFQCWPSQYQALPQLNASEDLVAVEQLTLQNEGWQRIATA
jgi:phage tail-like protein